MVPSVSVIRVPAAIFQLSCTPLPSGPFTIESTTVPGTVNPTSATAQSARVLPVELPTRARYSISLKFRY